MPVTVEVEGDGAEAEREVVGVSETKVSVVAEEAVAAEVE